MNDKRDQHRQRERGGGEGSFLFSKQVWTQTGHVRDAGGCEESESPFNYSTVLYLQKTGI